MLASWLKCWIFCYNHLTSIFISGLTMKFKPLFKTTTLNAKKFKKGCENILRGQKLCWVIQIFADSWVDFQQNLDSRKFTLNLTLFRFSKHEIHLPSLTIDKSENHNRKNHRKCLIPKHSSLTLTSTSCHHKQPFSKNSSFQKLTQSTSSEQPFSFKASRVRRWKKNIYPLVR